MLLKNSRKTVNCGKLANVHLNMFSLYNDGNLRYLVYGH